jgi:hypothetical protein
MFNPDECWNFLKAAGYASDQTQTALALSRSIGFIACCPEEVVAFFVGEQIAYATDCLPELIVGPGRGLSEQRLELRERHLNGV